jgi:hypothetical protein
MRALAAVFCIASSLQAQQPEPKADWKAIPPDLTVPAVTSGAPSAGKRVSQTAAGWEKTKVHHLLHLPTDWQPGKTYSVIIEYPGNGPYADARGDTCDGSVEGCLLGYGISGGKGILWATLPFIETKDGISQNAQRWWGDIDQTKRYCRDTVRDLCARFGGDPDRVFIAGFSRGSIACNFIGLHDDDIAKLWRGFICHSHYDGSRRWPGDGGKAAVFERLKRLGNRPQWISQEETTSATEKWLKSTGLTGDWTFVSMPFPNHSAAWVLRDLPERQKLRDWFGRAIR